jgi:hypothetical protein
VVQSARSSVPGRFKPDSEVQIAQEARDAILELRTTLQTLKQQEQRSWRQKSQLMRERRFETNAKKKAWATSDLSAALGEEALSLGAKVAQQRDAMQTLGDELRKDLRVRRKPALPVFVREPNYYEYGPHGAADTLDGSFVGGPVPPPMYTEMDPRTAAILARVEPGNHEFSLPELDPRAPKPEHEPEPETEQGARLGADYETDKVLVRGTALSAPPAEAEEAFAAELQAHFLPKTNSPKPPEISRVEHFRQLDAKARREKLLTSQREEAARVAAAAAASQALLDSEFKRRKTLADKAAATIISAELEVFLRADTSAAQPPTDQDAATAARETTRAEIDVEIQAAATRAAEVVAAGGGDAGLQRRVAQRWLLNEFARCTRMHR